jgi:hypothetical protein
VNIGRKAHYCKEEQSGSHCVEIDWLQGLYLISDFWMKRRRGEETHKHGNSSKAAGHFRAAAFKAVAAIYNDLKYIKYVPAFKIPENIVSYVDLSNVLKPSVGFIWEHK